MKATLIHLKLRKHISQAASTFLSYHEPCHGHKWQRQRCSNSIKVQLSNTKKSSSMIRIDWITHLIAPWRETIDHQVAGSNPIRGVLLSILSDSKKKACTISHNFNQVCDCSQQQQKWEEQLTLTLVGIWVLRSHCDNESKILIPVGKTAQKVDGWWSLGSENLCSELAKSEFSVDNLLI